MTHHESHAQATELSPEELDAQTGEQLPDREAMSLIDPSAGTAPIPIGADYDYDAPPNPEPGPFKA